MRWQATREVPSAQSAVKGTPREAPWKARGTLAAAWCFGKACAMGSLGGRMMLARGACDRSALPDCLVTLPHLAPALSYEAWVGLGRENLTFFT